MITFFVKKKSRARICEATNNPKTYALYYQLSDEDSLFNRAYNPPQFWQRFFLLLIILIFSISLVQILGELNSETAKKVKQQIVNDISWIAKNYTSDSFSFLDQSFLRMVTTIGLFLIAGIFLGLMIIFFGAAGTLFMTVIQAITVSISDRISKKKITKDNSSS